jgi:hypothetical protein
MCMDRHMNIQKPLPKLNNNPLKSGDFIHDFYIGYVRINLVIVSHTHTHTHRIYYR